MLEKRNAKGEEMTRYAFISHMEDYMKKLLTDPQNAEPDEFLKSFGLTGPVCLELLLKKSDNSDPDSSIITRKERIIKGEPDKNGKPTKDNFSIKYRIPRKDYTRKMRNAYISLFENYTCDNEIIKENMDKTIPDYSNILTEINANRLPELSKIKIEKDGNKIKFIFGKNMWGLTDELGKISQEIEKLSKTNNVYLVDSSLDPLDDIYDLTVRLDPINKEKEEKENKVRMERQRKKKEVKKRLSEDCEGEISGGATSADSSGQYEQPLFKKPIRRKLYITKEQLEYVKNKLMEDCPAETDTMFGDFGFDAPGLDIGKKDPAFDHKNIMDKSWNEKKKKKEQLEESQGLRSQKLFDIFKKYGRAYKDSSEAMDLHNATDNDVIGVFTSHDMPEYDEGKSAMAWANSKGYHMNPNDGLRFIELAKQINGDIIYAVVINRNANYDSYPDGKYNGGFKDYSLKKQQREKNKVQDGTKDYQWKDNDLPNMTFRNPYYKNWSPESKEKMKNIIKNTYSNK